MYTTVLATGQVYVGKDIRLSSSRLSDSGAHCQRRKSIKEYTIVFPTIARCEASYKDTGSKTRKPENAGLYGCGIRSDRCADFASQSWLIAFPRNFSSWESRIHRPSKSKSFCVKIRTGRAVVSLDLESFRSWAPSPPWFGSSFSGSVESTNDNYRVS